MFPRRIVSLVAALSLLLARPVGAEIGADTDGSAMLKSAAEAIDAYHQGAERAGNAIRVVYFVPRGSQPLDDWATRLQRILGDVERFYAEGYRRFGLSGRGVAFERAGEAFKVHRVDGRRPIDSYSYRSGGLIQREMQLELRDTFDLQREHVLALHALCRLEEDGGYAFSAPYYGSGSQRNGLCHAADCPLLDPDRLDETEQRIVYSEHYYERREQTVGKFNSRYLGGIAHEMGHGLGLPHDAGRPWEREQAGVSLMGGGNLHYRSQLNGGKTPSYLSVASALRLLSHPIVTGSDRGRFDDAGTELTGLSFSADASQLEVSGGVTGSIPCYGMLALVWRPRGEPFNSNRDHNSVSHPTLVKEGRFRIDLDGLRRGLYRLRLTALHTNGAGKNFDFRLVIDDRGRANLDELNTQFAIDRVVKAVREGDPSAKRLTGAEARAAAATPQIAAKLGVLHQLVEPPELIDLVSTDLLKVFLSDARWDTARVGWRAPARNYYDLNLETRRSVFLELDGKFYAKGLYAHSNATHKFELGGRWKKFTCKIGLRDGASREGSAIFTVLADGEQVYESPVLRSGKAEAVSLDLKGVKRLELRTRGGEGHKNHSWAIWVDPLLER